MQAKRNVRSVGIGATVLFGCLGALRLQEPVPAAVSPPATLALLVGINHYEAPVVGGGFAALEGPENDVARVRDLLITRFAFDPAGIKVLIGSQATHAGIVRAFHDHLIQRAGPDTRVVFWFSGHGSRIPDPSRKDTAARDGGDAPFDDTMVAYDSRSVAPTGSHDFTDDELHSLLAALRSNDVVVVTDCCHSGGVLRGGRAPGVRESAFGTAPLDQGRIKAFWPATVPFRDDDDTTDLPAVVHIAACGAQEEAGEFPTAAGTFGTLTWFLTQVLGDMAPNASWGEVGAIVRARVAGHGTRGGQSVQVAGDVGRAVFGGRGRAVAAGYQVDRYGARGLAVAAGRIHGLGEDAELHLVDLDGKELGLAKVRRVRATTCNADWQGTGDPPSVAMRARPKTVGQQKPPLRVFVEAGVDKAVLESCEVAVIEPDRSAAGYVLRAAGDDLLLFDSSGVGARRMQKDLQNVHLLLRREHLYRSLWEGVAEPGRYQVDIRVEPVTEAEAKAVNAERARKGRAAVARAEVWPTCVEGRGSVQALVGAAAFGPKAGGGFAKITVVNANDEDLHIAIVSATEDREVNVLLGTDANNVVRARDHVTRIVWLGPGENWPKNRSMLDRYVVIATPEYADFKPFESGATFEVVRGGSVVPNLPPFLREALGGARTRGPEMEKPAWGIGFCDLQVVTPGMFAKAKGK